MKKLFIVVSVFSMMITAVPVWAGGGHQNGVQGERADIYDIFVQSWAPVDLDTAEIQFFVDLLPPLSEVFMAKSSTGIKTFAYLSSDKFGCIAKLIPTPSGEYSEMIIENCQLTRQRMSGVATSNRTHHIVTTPTGAVKEFDSTVTWTFHYEADMQVTSADGTEYTGVWLIDMLVVNDGSPAMVQYTTVEEVGIVSKRIATVSW